VTGTTSSASPDRLAWANGLEPAVVWQEFAAISAIPRSSKHEQEVRQHVVERLAALGLTVQVDQAGNVVADIPASSQASSTAQVCCRRTWTWCVRPMKGSRRTQRWPACFPPSSTAGSRHRDDAGCR
jgi:hypothetical protein